MTSLHPETQAQPSAPDRNFVGAAKKVLRRVGIGTFDGKHRTGAHLTDTDAAMWSAEKDVAKQRHEAIESTRKDFLDGVEALIEDGTFAPQVAQRLSMASMTPVYDKIEHDPYLASVNGYVDPAGRFIMTNRPDDKYHIFHERAHTLYGLNPGHLSIFDEELADMTAELVMKKQDIKGRGSNQAVSNRTAQRIREAAGIGTYRLTEIASGPSNTENYQQLRTEVEQAVGWDAAGFADRAYNHYYNEALAKGIEPGYAIHEAAEEVSNLVVGWLGEDTQDTPSYA